MLGLVIDKLYKISHFKIVEEYEGILTFEISFNLNDYPNFHEYCNEKILKGERVLLEYSDKTLSPKFTGCSFTLGSISYNDLGEVEKINPRAVGTLDFEK